MAIIIEGGDLYGKTTLAEKSGWPIIAYPTPVSERTVERSYTDSMKIDGGNVVWDRWWPTEHIYGIYFKRHLGFPIDTIWKLGMLANRLGSVMLIPGLSVDELERRYSLRGDPELSLSQVVAIFARYHSFVEAYRNYLPQIVDNMGDAKELHEYLSGRVTELARIEMDSVGTLSENCTLLVKSEDENWYNLEYVWDVLDKTPLRPNNTHIISSMHSSTGKFPDWAKVLDFFKPKAIVAFGSEAHDRLRRAGIWCSAVPSPIFREKYEKENTRLYIERITKGVTNDCKTGFRVASV